MSRRAPDEAYELAAAAIPLGGASPAYHLSQITKAVDAAAPSIRSQERQRVEEAIKAEAKHLRGLARKYDQPTRYELQEASRRVDALAALDSPEDDDG